MTNYNSNDGLPVLIMWVITIGLSIGSGVLAWDWIEPDGFLSAVLFLIVWSLLSKAVHFIMFGIIMVVFDK